jgi:hypothetical protein
MFVERRTRKRSMTSTAPLPVPAVPSVPSLSLVPAPRLASPDAPDPAAPAANRPRFRRLVVFTGQLS